LGKTKRWLNREALSLISNSFYRLCTYLFDLLAIFHLHNLDYACLLSSQRICRLLFLRRLLLRVWCMVLFRTRIKRHHSGANGAAILKVRLSNMVPFFILARHPFYPSILLMGDYALFSTLLFLNTSRVIWAASALGHPFFFSHLLAQGVLYSGKV
jgi:hypothetical protein